jgi:hypothetical protein
VQAFIRFWVIFNGLFEEKKRSFKVLNKVLVIKRFEAKSIIIEMCKDGSYMFYWNKVHAKQS